MVSNRENETNKRPAGKPAENMGNVSGTGTEEIDDREETTQYRRLGGGGDVKKVDIRQMEKIINSGIGGQRERLMRFEHNILVAERIDYMETV